MNIRKPYSKAFNKPAFGSGIGASAAALTESPNEGGITAMEYAEASQSTVHPRLVIRGENPLINHKPLLSTLNPKAAIVDWLNFSFLYPMFEGSALLTLDEMFRNAFGFGLRVNRYRGHMNYEHSWELGNHFGIFAYGGSSVGGTAFFSISSEGCTATKDWNAVYGLLNTLMANITRLDLAHDDFIGTHNIQTALCFYETGAFNNIHGRPPKPKLINDFDTGSGKTFYIGSRKNGKLLRVYEKGKQLGNPESLWVRWELELHNSSCIIPIDAIIKPGQYLAGSYPCLGWISADQLYFESIKQAQTISLDMLIKACRNSYGKLINVMSTALGYSDSQIIQLLIKDGIPSRLNKPAVGGGDAL